MVHINRMQIRQFFTAVSWGIWGASFPLQASLHEYHVKVAPDLSTLSVEAQLSGRHRRLKTGDAAAANYLRQPLLCENEQRLIVRSGQIRLQNQENPCLHYRVTLSDIAGTDWRSQIALDSSNRSVNVNQWLWRPSITDSTTIQVSFELPPGINVSVPWQTVDEDTYRFGASPRSADAISVFGRFDYHEVEVAGATLRVSLLKGATEMDEAMILRWIQSTATDVTLPYGRFPNPNPQIIVVPVGGLGYSGRSAIPFGHVLRDGGEAIRFFVDQTRPFEDLRNDWTATHEFSHLMLPYVTRQQNWISEGFASYYQNVLLARAGVYSEAEAWQRLNRGIQQAVETGGRMSPNEASQGEFWKARMMIYWSGAAIALIADTTLREQTNNKESLDTVLGRLQMCCLPSDHMWQGRELFAKLDALSEPKVFLAIYDEYADKPGIPDLRELYQRLGILVANNKMTFNDAAPSAEVRRGIMGVVDK